jgi:hypothetical protein
MDRPLWLSMSHRQPASGGANRPLQGKTDAETGCGTFAAQSDVQEAPWQHQLNTHLRRPAETACLSVRR